MRWKATTRMLARPEIDFDSPEAMEASLPPAALALKIFHVPRLNGAQFGVLRIDARKFARM